MSRLRDLTVALEDDASRMGMLQGRTGSVIQSRFGGAVYSK